MDATRYRRNLGRTDYEAVRSRIQPPTGKRRVHKHHPRPSHTRHHYRAHGGNGERKYSDHDQRQGQCFRRLFDAERVKDVVADIAESQQQRLNANQRSAIETILSSDDQIIGLQGGAGTGKTTALSVLREAAEKEGYEVRGFAPTTRAAKQLGESGIQTETLQKFLCRRQEPTASTPFRVG